MVRGVIEALWIVIPLVGLFFTLKSVAAAHADFAAAAKFSGRYTVEFLFASSVYRSQWFRTTKLVVIMVAGVISLITSPDTPWRPYTLLIVLTLIPVITTIDAFMHEKSRVRIKTAQDSGNGGRHE